ncbi:hypothetical protein [Anaerotalea alkaliphila]|uniref:Uncharacterized protein n=1 Tax=Anaerotalea alkaliphila TaxID=2662126 RepID=A0A7X5HXL8_9FIRM|nr:hypothetical protein [Anaerotalea alkaliphila]NDL68500.1 hypothetical protein [Anaerotalea alkaliphila]
MIWIRTQEHELIETGFITTADNRIQIVAMVPGLDKIAGVGTYTEDRAKEIIEDIRVHIIKGLPVYDMPAE